MRVAYTPRAARDLQAISTYLADRNPSAARSVIAAIRRLIEGLGDFPQMGHLTDRSGTYSITLTRYPYRVFYRVLGEEVQIVHIRHGSRRPWGPGES